MSWPGHKQVLGIASGFWIWVCLPFACWSESMYLLHTYMPFPVRRKVSNIRRNRTHLISSSFPFTLLFSSFFYARLFILWIFGPDASLPTLVDLLLTDQGVAGSECSEVSKPATVPLVHITLQPFQPSSE
jgi:hypothetical protein